MTLSMFSSITRESSCLRYMTIMQFTGYIWLRRNDLLYSIFSTPSSLLWPIEHQSHQLGKVRKGKPRSVLPRHCSFNYLRRSSANLSERGETTCSLRISVKRRRSSKSWWNGLKTGEEQRKLWRH